MSVLYRSWVLLVIGVQRGKQQGSLRRGSARRASAGEGAVDPWRTGTLACRPPKDRQECLSSTETGGADYLPLRAHAALRHDRGERGPCHRRFRGAGDRAERDGEEEIEVHEVLAYRKRHERSEQS